jgi:hypothetical protein
METKHGEARANETNLPQVDIESYRLHHNQDKLTKVYVPTNTVPLFDVAAQVNVDGAAEKEFGKAFNTTQGVKHDQGKARYDLLPPEALAGLAEILGYGAAKYAPHNWRKGMDWSRVFAAAQRHVWAYWTGEDTDPESGLPHIDHALCCLAFLSAYQKAGLGTDDRNNLLESLRAR